MRNQDQPLMWHYTYGATINLIMDSGVLLPPYLTPAYSVQERNAQALGLFNTKGSKKAWIADARMLLFSQRQDWEPASFRGVESMSGGRKDLLTLEEYEKYGIMAYRIGVDRNILHPYMKLKRLVNIPAEMAEKLTTIAIKVGGNPFDWWGTTKPVPHEKWLAVEAYDPTTKAWENALKTNEEAPEAEAVAARA